MILSDLKAYLKERGRAPIEDLANRFHTDPAAIRGMLETWIAKGRVRRIDPEAGDCTGCNKCDSFKLEIYEWTG